jgi:hypothetical protein
MELFDFAREYGADVKNILYEASAAYPYALILTGSGVLLISSLFLNDSLKAVIGVSGCGYAIYKIRARSLQDPEERAKPFWWNAWGWLK